MLTIYRILVPPARPAVMLGLAGSGRPYRPAPAGHRAWLPRRGGEWGVWSGRPAGRGTQCRHSLHSDVTQIRRPSRRPPRRGGVRPDRSRVARHKCDSDSDYGSGGDCSESDHRASQAKTCPAIGPLAPAIPPPPRFPRHCRRREGVAEVAKLCPAAAKGCDMQ